MVTITDRVRFYETDLMGVVYHANYLKWFEMGRVAYFREAGIDLNKLMEDGYMVPIVEVHCKYHQSAKFDDEFQVETTLTDVNRIKFVFQYKVLRKKDGVLLAEGWSKNAFTNLEGKPVRLTPAYYEKLQNVLEKERKN